jgi:hypothetical protein
VAVNGDEGELEMDEVKEGVTYLGLSSAWIYPPSSCLGEVGTSTFCYKR